ncbi:MAG: AAA family ATPase, partial [Chloroflexi bacterium]|nr:AAA family ATPase [Chloroflexota bacterium]
MTALRDLLRIQLLGGLDLAWDDQPLPPPAGAVARSLLAYLVMFRDRPHPRELLAGTFWPDLPDPVARRRLRQALWQLRRSLDDLPSPIPFLLADTQTVQFNPAAPVWLDVDDFIKSPTLNSKPQRGGLAIGREAWDLEFGILRDAVALYRGDFLPGVYDDWGLVQREQLRTRYLDVLGRLVAGLAAQGAYEEALGYARQLVAEDPLREESHREIMQLCQQLGRLPEALKQYERCQIFLMNELSVAPAPETTALARQIAALAEDLTHSVQSTVHKEGAVLPLVGRQAERATLLRHVEQALAGHGGLVLVEGEAGVGKTRLLQDIAQGAAWRGMPVARGRGLELAPASPYGILTEALGAALSPLRAGQLAEMVPGIELRAAGGLIPALTAGLPRDALPPHVSLGPAQDRARLLDALAQVILALGQITPHLLILEDLHWADESTLAALTHLMPHLGHSPILVIGSYRGGEARERPAIWQALQMLDKAGLWDRLVLERLDAAAAGELVRLSLGLAAEAPRFEARLYAETQGNPLFLLETLRALRDEGLLTRDAAGAWRTRWDETTVDYAELPLPASVTQVIARRLARLDAPTRAVLNAGAVLGGDFDLAILAQVGRLDRQAVLAAVSDLVRRRFLAEGPAAYTFTHDQVRRAVYRALSFDERRQLHVRAGEDLEDLHPDRVEALAQHFDRGGVPEKALAYMLQAGERAEGIYDYPAALACYERALVLVGQAPAVRWDVLARQEQVLEILGRREIQTEVLAEMLHLAKELDDPVRQTRTYYRQGWWQVLAGKPDQALTLLDQATLLARTAGELGLLGICLRTVAWAWFRMGDVARCRAAAEEAQTLLHEAGDRDGEALTLNMLGSLHLALTGNYAQALACFEECRRIASEIGNLYRASLSLGNVAFACTSLGDYHASQSALAEMLAFLVDVGARGQESTCLFWQGRNYRGLGNLEQAYQSAWRALELGRQASNPNFEIEILGLLGQIALDQSDPQQAHDWFQQAVTMAETHMQMLDRAEQLSHLALAHSR